MSVWASAKIGHDRTVLSLEPVSANRPLGENVTARMSLLYEEPVRSERVAMALPDATSHSRVVLYAEPVSTSRPSGEKATALTGPAYPDRVARGLADATSHSRAVLS